MLADKKLVSSEVKNKAFALGFDLAGIAAVAKLGDHASILKSWGEAGMNADMSYLCRDVEKRTDPSILYPGAKSVIAVGLNYYTDSKIGGEGVPVISRYAYGENYHDVILRKLGILLSFLQEISPGTNGRAFVDSAPILEKAWARMAGLGWPGRHSVLINNKIGSFFFLGILLTDVELDYDQPYEADYCGKCNLCIEACPTIAINNNRTIDTRKCIAYQTIEQKAPVDDFVSERSGLRIFGCDICQDVCPWNRHAVNNQTKEFEPSADLRKMSVADWKNLTREDFRRIFRHSAIGRKKYEVFMKNIQAVIN